MPDRVHTDRPARTAAAPGAHDTEPAYYDVPILQPPVWKWEIANYFFWGGLSAGAYLLARLAERFGRGRYREVTRTGTIAAFLTALPCAPLLIHDLGDPKRFHHMLRVWKPGTPMNLGTWTLTAYSGMVTAAVLREYLRDRRPHEPAELRRLTNGTLLAVHDAAGLPLALLVAGYTGVLLSCTANPLWCRNDWLGPLFSASALSTGAEAISLVLNARNRATEETQRALDHVDTAAHAAELVSLAGFMRQAGEKAAPLRRGSMKKHLWLSVGGILAAEAVKRVPVRPKLKPWRNVLSAGLGLAAGFSLRWAMVYGGHEAAEDPHLARLGTGSGGQALAEELTAGTFVAEDVAASTEIYREPQP